LLLGSAYLRKNDLDKALEAFQNAVDLVPDNPEGRYYLGLTLKAKGRFVEAQRQLEAALALSPSHVPSLTQLVAIEFASRRPAQAVARIERQIELVPNSGAHFHLLGNAYMTIEESDKAVDAFLKAIEFEPQMMPPYIQIAKIYGRSGQYEDALRKMNEAVAQNPKDPGSLMILGMLQEANGDTQSAQATYGKILEIQSDFAPAANNLAYIIVSQDGDLDKALQLAETARAADPENPLIADTLGWVLHRRGTYDRALSILKESASKVPDNPEIQFHLGMTYFRLNQHEAAWLALKRALELSTDFPGAEEAREVIEELKKY
jgi:tetratricopeptide (TPR) repeat protein